MENVKFIVDRGICTGCSACNICEHIEFIKNKYGGYSPKIDDGCINCGKCLAECIYNPDREDDE